MIQYNNYNNNYYLQIQELNQQFNDYNKQDYFKLLQLIYFTLYQENIFKIINNDIKFLIFSIIKILNNNFWERNYYTYSKDIQEIIQLVFVIIAETSPQTNYLINLNTKKKLEFLLLENKIINELDIKQNKNIYLAGMNKNNKCIFDANKIKNFFDTFNINFSNTILEIKDIKIPNFLLSKENELFKMEFLHLLFKTYAPYLYYNKIFQEGYEYQITSSDIVFDCGANIGLFALYCAAKGAQVYCFEPMSYNRKFLKISQSLYPNNIHIIPYGISNKSGIIKLQQMVNPATCNENYNKNKDEFLYQEKCHLLSLDNFCAQTSIYPTFIKMDIEGAEQKALEGAKDLLKNYKPIIHIALNHYLNDPINLLSKIYSINNVYQFYKNFEGTANSQFALCK